MNARDLALAAALTSVMACDDHAPVTRDATIADSPVDANPAVIHVMVWDETMPGTPAVGARVVFEAPDHSIQTVITGADGIAEAASPPGTTVTAIQELLPTEGKVFTSFRDLGPGVSVVAGPPDPRRQFVGTVSVSMPELPGGMYYEMRVPCTEEISGSSQPMSVFVYSPCASATSATLVGRVRDANHQLLGVSVLTGVDLPAAIGNGTIAMPPYTQQATSLSLDVENVPTAADTVGWLVVYRQQTAQIHDALDISQYLEREGSNGAAPGNVALAIPAYPVGDETELAVTFHAAGAAGAFTNYVSVEQSVATQFSLDASPMLLSLDDPAEISPAAVSWSPTAGAPPTLVDVAVTWDTIHGTIYAPYSGPSLALDDLPGELLTTSTPVLVSLAAYSANGLGYEDVVAAMREYADYWKGYLPAWASATPVLPAFWTSIYHGAY